MNRRQPTTTSGSGSTMIKAAEAIGSMVKSGTRSTGKSLYKKPKNKKNEDKETGKSSTKKPPSKPKKPESSKPKRPEPSMRGPEATHARNMDTGRPVKLTNAQKKSIDKDINRIAATPAIDLTGSQFR